MKKNDSKTNEGKANTRKLLNKAKEMKVCFLGDTCVGKTSIIYRYTRHHFEERLPATVAGSGQTVEVDYFSQRFKCWLWDLGGQETYRSVVPNYFRGASAFILVYDCTRESTFSSIQIWHDLTQRHTGCWNDTDDIIYLLVGNKIDKRSETVVDTEKGKELAKQLKCIFHETSALSGEGVITLFDKLCQKKLEIERRKKEENENTNNASAENESRMTSSVITLSDRQPQQQQRPTNSSSSCKC